jgi:hypothetical protein
MTALIIDKRKRVIFRGDSKDGFHHVSAVVTTHP